MAQIPDVQDILKIVLAVPRKQVLGDCAATVGWAKKRPGVRADRVGVTGWCWGGSTVYQVAATNPDIKAAVCWYGPPARPYPYKPDLIMIPIGGHHVMDPKDAAYATREMIKPKYAIPFHYATIPVLKGTPQEYQAALGQTTTQVFPISPGDKLTF